MTRQVIRLLSAVVLLVLAVAALAASVYRVTLPMDLSVGGTNLKSGEYSVSVENNQAVFKRGKQTFQVPVDVEKADHKFSQTTLEMDGMTLRVINLGGTNSVLVFPH